MEKVIMLSGECGDDETLVAFIRLLMPQCNVKVVSKGTKAAEIFGSEAKLATGRFEHLEQDI